jgi:hypothetical protein
MDPLHGHLIAIGNLTIFFVFKWWNIAVTYHTTCPNLKKMKIRIATG